MKKRLKWLLVGSLMCLGLGSVFHQGYGMKRKLEDNEQLSNKEQKREGICLCDDAIFHIMTFLTPRDILKLGETCKGLQEISNKEYLWKQKAVEAGASQVELDKVKKKFFTYQQIIEGHEYWNKYDEVKDSEDVTNKEKLTLLMQAADLGNEEAISCLFCPYLFGNDPEGLDQAKKYADKGSERAKRFLIENK